jgi:hypothetical protein
MLVAAYPAAQVSEQTVEVYVTMLHDLDRSPVEQAIVRLIATSKFLPTVAEIRAMAVSVERGAERRGVEAWGDVLSEIRRVGVYGKPRFGDPLTAECVRMLGWRTLCESSHDFADRARFAELYDERQNRERQDAVAGRALPAPLGERLNLSLPSAPPKQSRDPEQERAKLEAWEKGTT